MNRVKVTKTLHNALHVTIKIHYNFLNSIHGDKLDPCLIPALSCIVSPIQPLSVKRVIEEFIWEQNL